MARSTTDTPPQQLPADTTRTRLRVRARRAHRGWWGTAAIALVVLFVAVYPLGLLLFRSFQVSQPWEVFQPGLDNWTQAFSHPLFPGTILDTFLLAFARVAIAGSLGVFFAWAVTRTNMPWKRPIEITMWLGFFLPALPMVFGWLLVLEPTSGVFNQLLRSVLGDDFGGLNIYSHWGIVLAHLASSTSVMFILVSPAFRNVDAALEESGSVSGLGRFAVFRKITVPIVAPSVGVATILVLVKSLESFELELILGVPDGIYVYSTLVWLFLRLDPPMYGAATALSVVFLIGIVILIIIQRRSLGARDFTTISARGFGARKIDLGRARWVVTGSALFFIAAFIVLPLTFLVLGTLMRVFGFFDISDPWTTEHWTEALTAPGFSGSLVNTLVLGTGAAVIGALLYSIVAYWLVRTRSRLRGTLDFLTWLPWALPGVLIGLAILWMALGSGPVLRMLYSTVWVLILAIIIKEFPLGVQMLKAGVMQIDPALEESARTSGLSRVGTFRRVTLPLLRPTAIMVGLISFIVAVREIPAVIFLVRSTDAPLAPRMLLLMEEGQLERGAVIGLLITVTILIAASVSLWLNLKSLGRSK